jgi:hypothetical protein
MDGHETPLAKASRELSEEQDRAARADAVNTVEDGDDVVIYLRVNSVWRSFAVSKPDAVTLADMLRLNTRSTD